MTKHLNETCEYLLKFCVKYYTKYSNSQEGGGDDGEAPPPVPICLQAKKKSSQLQKENIGIHMLCNVPHISAHIATQLLEPFENNLTDFLEKIRTEPQYLDGIKIKTRDKKERKLAKNIREVLVEYFG